MDATNNHQGDGDDKGQYGYMFKSGGQRFLFIRNFGNGIESMGQLVKNMDTGEILIRKVTLGRWLRTPKPPSKQIKHWRARKPDEFKVLDTVLGSTFKNPGPDVHIAECYKHEFIESKHIDAKGNTKYSSVSYWKLCNGGAAAEWRLRDKASDVPVMVVARMVKQVLSTLDHLYTAGDAPVYHRDPHLGNVWINWEAGASIPDFYLGDFGFAEIALPPINTNWGAPTDTTVSTSTDYSGFTNRGDVHDFAIFDKNLEDVVYGVTIGRYDAAAQALNKLYDDFYDKVKGWMRHKPQPGAAPLDFKDLIAQARSLEESCKQGGATDETQTQVYINYVKEGRAQALKTANESPMIVHGAKHDALRPQEPSTLDPNQLVPMRIHGPWHLVRRDAAGNWVPVEADDVTHHRPNIEPVEDEDLSITDVNASVRRFLETDYGSTTTDEIINKISSSFVYEGEVLNTEEILMQGRQNRAIAAATTGQPPPILPPPTTTRVQTNTNAAPAQGYTLTAPGQTRATTHRHLTQANTHMAPAQAPAYGIQAPVQPNTNTVPARATHRSPAHANRITANPPANLSSPVYPFGMSPAWAKSILQKLHAGLPGHGPRCRCAPAVHLADLDTAMWNENLAPKRRAIVRGLVNLANGREVDYVELVELWKS